VVQLLDIKEDVIGQITIQEWGMIEGEVFEKQQEGAMKELRGRSKRSGRSRNGKRF
jgi:hypothetical protein